MAACGAAFLVTAAIEYHASRIVPFEIACLVTAAAALWFSARVEAPPVVMLERPAPASGGGLSLDMVAVLLAVAMLAFYFFTSIPDPDDSLFLNFAVGAKHARDALYAHDTMLGLPGLAFMKSTYRLESYQLLAALISDVSGCSVVFAAHTVIPALVCAWAAATLTLIHAALFPRRFGLTLVFHMAVLVAMDGTFQSYGYHAIPRFFEGKGPFVTVMIPLIAVLTLIALRTGSWRALHLLTAAVIVSLGFTANAVYVAPLAVALIAVTWLILAGPERWRVLRLAEIVVYPAAMVVILLLTDPPGPSEMLGAGTVGGILWSVFGSPPGLVFALGFLYLMACLPLLNRGFRPLTVYLCVALVLVLNPLLWPLYGKFVTGYVNNRLAWSLPFPLLVALALGLVWSSRGKVAQVAVLILLGLGVAGPGSILHKAEYGLTLAKVPQSDFALAQKVADSVGEARLVLAPERVAQWLPVLENHPPVVEARGLYIPQRFDGRFRPILTERGNLYLFWNGKAGGSFADPEAFLAAARQIGVDAVVVDLRDPLQRALMPPLMQGGYGIGWQEREMVLLIRHS